MASTTQRYQAYVFWSCAWKKKKDIIVFIFISLLRLQHVVIFKKYLYFPFFEFPIHNLSSFFYWFINLFLTYFWKPLILCNINCKFFSVCHLFLDLGYDILPRIWYFYAVDFTLKKSFIASVFWIMVINVSACKKL